MEYIFFKSGRAREVFRALLVAALLEAKFGRPLEQLEPCDFSKN